ncbi:MAG TPA: DUF2314 domain-containing protein [Lacunisphaera sp.]|nr:DUF2314 domain-containing protein [Lacunisphaera sp.]
MNQDPIFTVSGNDPEMNAAIKKAQDSFPEFIRELELESRRVIPALDEAIVKAFFFDPESPEEGEHMFVESIRFEDGMIHGVLSGEPQHLQSYSLGQEVSFPVSRVSDWFVVIGGRGKGGYTLEIIARRMPATVYREARSQPPFSWFDLKPRPWWKLW